MVTTHRTLNTKANEICKQPIIVPLPQTVPGVAHPVLRLGGTWKLNVAPPAEFWSNRIDPASWADAAVPGYAAKLDNFGAGESWAHDAPVLHDEYAHGPCYDHSEQRRDPGVRDFWGESIKRFWDNIFTTQGALGGAIWGGIDDVMITPRGYTQWEWGIYDGWRREKPEYWLTKKAYSPIRVPEEPLTHPGKGRPLTIAIQNRFDHTNLSEIAVHWAVGTDAGVLSGPALAPHGEGLLELPARDWADGEVLNLQFYRMGDLLVDEYNLSIGDPAVRFSGPQGPPPGVSEDTSTLTVSGADFEVVFDKATGQVIRGTYSDA